MVQAEFDQIARQMADEQGAEHDHDHDHDHDHEHDHDHDHAPAAPELTDEQRKEYMSIAERRVRLGLLLSEIGTSNNITVGQDEINREMTNQARRFPGQEQQVFDFFRQNPSALAQLQAPLFEDKVVDFIIEMAEVSDRTVSREELARDPDEETETKQAAEEKPKAKKAAAKKSTAKAKKAKAKEE
jgi:trigger factor